jgi:hypothetical protein
MSIFEDRLRDTLNEMADEVRPVAMLPRLQHRQTRRHTQLRNLRVAAIAAAIIGALVAGSLILLRAGNPRVIEPVDHPPKTIRLVSAETAAPGRTALLLVIADNTSTTVINEKPAYALPVGGHHAILVKETNPDAVWTDHLSLDGTRLVREVTNRDDSGFAPSRGMEILDLQTGAVDDVHGATATCPALSPDNRMVAAYRSNDMILIDVATGGEHPIGLHGAGRAYCAGTFAWSPDASRVVGPDDADSVVLDRRGRHRSRLTGVHVANGSMSWSPDGRFLLLYNAGNAQFVVRDMEERTNSGLQRPPDAVRPLGWAGSRIVWLIGQVGDQRLVTTDSSGRDPRLWTRLETDGLPIESVSWSNDLAGTVG